LRNSLRTAKKPEDIAKNFNIYVAAQNVWSFVWQQAVVGGIKDCEKEVKSQKKSDFALSYGVSDIIEFASKKDVNDELDSLAKEIEGAKIILGRDNQDNDPLVSKYFGVKKSKVTDQMRQDFRDMISDRAYQASIRYDSLNKEKEKRSTRERQKREVTEKGKEAIERANEAKQTGRAVSPEDLELIRQYQEQKQQKETTSEADKILAKEAREKQKKQRRVNWASKKRQELTPSYLTAKQRERDQYEKENADSVEKALASLNLTTQREIRRNYSNRYSSVKEDSYFARVYTQKRGEQISSSMNDNLQSTIKLKVSEYVRSQKKPKNQEDLLNNLIRDLDPDPRAEKTREAVDLLRGKLESRKTVITQKQLDASASFDPSQDDELNDLSEDIAATAQEVSKLLNGRRSASLKGEEKQRYNKLVLETNGLRDLKTQYREKLREVRRNAGLSEVPYPPSIKKKMEKVERRTQKDLENQSNLVNSKSREIFNLKEALKSKDSDIFSIVNLTPPPAGASKAQQLEMRSAARSLINQRIASETKILERATSRVTELQRRIDQEDFSITIDPKKVKLSDQEKRMLADSLGYKSEGAIRSLDKEMSGADLRRLIGVAERKGSIYFDERVTKQAEAVAITEVSAAYNLGRIEAFYEEGVKYVTWVSVLDDRTSEFCQGMNGRVFKIEEVRNVILSMQPIPNTTALPEDPSNRILSPSGVWVPPVHPRCRSYLHPIYLPEDEKYLARDLGVKTDKLGNVIPYTGQNDLESVRLLESLQKQSRAFKNKEKNQVKKKAVDLLIYRLKRGSPSLRRSLFNVLRYGDLYQQGISFLVNKLNSDGNKTITKEEIQKNDKPLMKVILGGAAIFSAGSLLYLLHKSKLLDGIQEYVGERLAEEVEEGKNFLGEMGEEAVRRAVEGIVGELKALPPGVVGELTKKENSDKDFIVDITSKSGQEVDALLNRGETAVALAINGVPTEDLSKVLLPQGSKIDALYREKIREELFRKINSETSKIRRDVLSITNEVLGDIGLATSLENIDKISVNYNGSISVKYKPDYLSRTPGRKPTLLSGKKYLKTISDKSFDSRLELASNRINQLEKVLQDLAETEKDPIQKSFIQREISRLESLKGLNNIRSLERVKNLKNLENIRNNAAEADSFGYRRVKEMEAGIERYNREASKVLDSFRSKMPGEDIFSILPDSIESIDTAEYLLNTVERAVSKAEEEFIEKSGKKFRVRKIEDMVDLSLTLSELEQAYRELQNHSGRIDYKSQLTRMNVTIGNEILEYYRKLLQLRKELAERIIELES
jgi:SPP1 gp7 family putative phage head morphogenesis protein